MTILRDYQQVCVDRTFAEWARGLRRVAAVLPTGAGKTVIFSALIHRFRELYPDEKVLVLAHRGELLDQAAAKLRDAAPDLRVGLVMAGANQVSADVIVASQQTLARPNRLARLPRIGLVVVDETHRAMGPSYLRVLEDLGCLEPDGPLTLGVTATFTREDKFRLTDFFQSVSFSLDILDLIGHDPPYLVPPRFKRVLVEGLDLSGVRVSRVDGARDLAAGELDEAMERAGAPGVVAAAYRAHAADRSGIVFCPTVSSAEHVAQALADLGITAESLAGSTPKAQRQDILARFKLGLLQVVTNCGVLTEGFDAPRTSCIVIARPTMSKILFRQMVGRGLRLFAGKEDALILDVVGATGRNDLRTLNDITEMDLDIKEDERLDEAVQRTIGEGGGREELIGDAMISGSLAAVDVDPWAMEWARGRPRRATGEALTDEEIEAERLRIQAEQEQRAVERERRERRRYKHVPMRSGWFLVTPRQRYFIPLETATRQKGFVAVIEAPGTQNPFIVALWLQGVDRDVLRRYGTEEKAAQFALDFTLKVVETAMERHMVDPDARWRRKQAGERQVEVAERHVRGIDFDEYHYSGQCSDFITWGKWHRNVDAFADRIASEAMSVVA